jgi:hypothetical protein
MLAEWGKGKAKDGCRKGVSGPDVADDEDMLNQCVTWATLQFAMMAQYWTGEHGVNNVCLCY